MNVLAYTLSLFGGLRRTGEECAKSFGVDRCPIVRRLEHLDVYSQTMILRSRAVRIKRIALTIVAVDIVCAIIQGFNFMVIAKFDSHLAMSCFVLLIVRTFLILGVYGLIIGMLSTGHLKNHNGK